jgi:hypothetical protein
MGTSQALRHRLRRPGGRRDSRWLTPRLGKQEHDPERADVAATPVPASADDRFAGRPALADARLLDGRAVRDGIGMAQVADLEALDLDGDRGGVIAVVGFRDELGRDARAGAGVVAASAHQGEQLVLVAALANDRDLHVAGDREGILERRALEERPAAAGSGPPRSRRRRPIPPPRPQPKQYQRHPSASTWSDGW